MTRLPRVALAALLLAGAGCVADVPADPAEGAATTAPQGTIGIDPLDDTVDEAHRSAAAAAAATVDSIVGAAMATAVADQRPLTPTDLVTAAAGMAAVTVTPTGTDRAEITVGAGTEPAVTCVVLAGDGNATPQPGPC